MHPVDARLRRVFPSLMTAAALAAVAHAAFAGASARTPDDPVVQPSDLDFDYSAELHPGLDQSQLHALDNTPDENGLTDAGAALGRVLFYDKRLSRNRRIACASCHKQENAFADTKARSVGFMGKRTRRNSMSLSNVAYYENGHFFWDERGTTLEEMVLMPLQDRVEMGMDLDLVVERVQSEASYRYLFAKAFGDSEVDSERIGMALAQFLRSMVSFRSKFDEGLARTGTLEKDFPNFTAEENLGKRIFMGLHEGGDTKSSCASCHMRDLGSEVSGTAQSHGAAPVLFQGNEPTNNGLQRGRVGDDLGRAGITNDGNDVGKFKVPSLRNVELTGPYMHDGRIRTLEKVVEHYTKSIRVTPTLDQRLRPTTTGWGARGGPRTPAPMPGCDPPGPSTPRPSAPERPATPPPSLPTTPGGATSPGKLAERVVSTGATAPASMPSSVQFGRVPTTGFGFSQEEQKALIAFLKTLTDKEFITNPKFSDPFAKN